MKHPFSTMALSCAAGAAVTLLIGLSGCRNSGAEESAGSIDTEQLGRTSSERPEVVFPTEFQQKDPAINNFIQEALQICAEGDYDRFRGLFGINYIKEAPSETDFARVWRGVRRVSVAGVYPGKPDEYYVYAIVELRKKNRKDELERPTVIRVFREEQTWRIGPAPREVTLKILSATTQPSGKTGATARPARGATTSRPVESGTPASRPEALP